MTFNEGPFGGHHLGGDSCPPITFGVVPLKIHGPHLRSAPLFSQHRGLTTSGGRPDLRSSRHFCHAPPALAGCAPRLSPAASFSRWGTHKAAAATVGLGMFQIVGVARKL